MHVIDREVDKIDNVVLTIQPFAKPQKNHFGLSHQDFIIPGAKLASSRFAFGSESRSFCL